ncbi:hypothetical protein BDV93DRAFT_358521 [Ceratobasidium sp. AG-I]|nr:hypothetical protein BDV93DRAFT_358521 [Ceratobasidium sp. AG-I]
MGLCGVSTTDPRVQKAAKLFMKLLEGTKPGRTPDAFLLLPMLIFGVGCQRQRDRDILYRRMVNIRECSQPNTGGNDGLRILQAVWALSDTESRPALYSDLRTASLRITGL